MLGCAWISAEPTLVDNTLLVVFLPLSLAVVMAGLGLHLTLADFRRVLQVPRAVAVALVVQSLLLPPVAIGLCLAFKLPGELALGLVLLAASPGGVTANLFSHIARGDVALNITLTAINSLLALLTQGDNTFRQWQRPLLNLMYRLKQLTLGRCYIATIGKQLIHRLA